MTLSGGPQWGTAHDSFSGGGSGEAETVRSGVVTPVLRSATAWRFWGPLVLGLYLAAWTFLLVTPEPLETLGLRRVVETTQLKEIFEPVSYAVHVTGYLILGAIVSSLEIRGRPRWLSAVLWLAGVAHGGLTEIIQSFIPTRSADLWDFAADTAGMLLGALVWRWIAAKRGPGASVPPGASPPQAEE